jgi:hypothetical protein
MYCGVVWYGRVWYGAPTVESRFMRNILACIRLCVVGDEKIMHPDNGGSRTSRNVVSSMNLHNVTLEKTSS